MSFTFNGVNCESLGMKVQRYPARPFPQRKQTVYKVPGRSGDLIVDENAFENVKQEYEVYVGEGSGRSMQERLTAVAEWLLSPRGYCVLTDSYDQNIKRLARFVGGVEFLNSLNKFGSATAVFDCKPQRYPVTDVELTETLESGVNTITLPDSGLMDSYPLLEILAVGANTSFRVLAGDLQITVPARGTAISKIVIDWETQSVYNAYNGSVPSNTSVAGNWGPIGDGDTITINIETNPIPTIRLYPRQYSV